MDPCLFLFSSCILFLSSCFCILDIALGFPDSGGKENRRRLSALLPVNDSRKRFRVRESVGHCELRAASGQLPSCVVSVGITPCSEWPGTAKDRGNGTGVLLKGSVGMKSAPNEANVAKGGDASNTTCSLHSPR